MMKFLPKLTRPIALLLAGVFSFTILLFGPWATGQSMATTPRGNGVNVILMIGDGMGWEMARAAAVNQGAPLYKSGKGRGLNMQRLTGYTYATNYGTTISDGTKFNTSNSALSGNRNAVTGKNPVRPGFAFKPLPFNPGIDINPKTAEGGAPDSPNLGNLVGYDPARGGPNPWTPLKPETCNIPLNDPQRYTCKSEYIKLSYPDSANTAATLYTGVKSYNGAISVDIFEKQPVETILQVASRLGKSTGLVTSVPISHATPGAATAHVNRRGKYDGDFPALDNILQQAIRKDIPASTSDRPDLQKPFLPTVLLGGGHPLDHDNTVNTPGKPGYKPPGTCTYTYIKASTYKELSGKTSLSDTDACKAAPRPRTTNRYGYRFLERGRNAGNTLLAFSRAINPNRGERLLGLYGARGQEGNLPVNDAQGRYLNTGLAQFARLTSLYFRSGVDWKPGDLPVNDTDRPLALGETTARFIQKERNQNPTLSQMTQAALNVLGKDQDGFWLMVEGGDVDWSAHDNNMDNLLGTMRDFDAAIGTVINWINRNGGWQKNVLIVTADHDHYLTLYDNFPQLLRRRGARALTFGTETAVQQVGHSWSSLPDQKYGWGNHSRRMIPVYYQGDRLRLSRFIGRGFKAYGFDVPGVPNAVDQVHIHQAMLDALARPL